MILTAMYNMYHTLKVGHLCVVDTAQRSGRFGPCCKIASNVAREYSILYNNYFPDADSVQPASEVQADG